MTRSLLQPLAGGWQSLRRRRAYRQEIRAALAGGRKPVIVFTMAKSASTSVEVSLMQLPELAVYKAHRLHPPRIREYYRERRRRGEAERYRFVDDLGLALHDEIIRRRVPAPIVVLVREPIGRASPRTCCGTVPMCSRWIRPNSPPASWNGAARRFRSSGSTRSSGRSRRRHLRPPPSRTTSALSGSRRVPLVLRSDLQHPQKSSRLADWLGRRSFDIVRMNEAGEKQYSGKHEAARRAMQLQPAYIDAMLESKYARHFFSPGELAGLRLTWGRSEAAPVQGDPA